MSSHTGLHALQKTIESTLDFALTHGAFGSFAIDYEAYKKDHKCPVISQTNSIG